jgi:hypothetical protein
MGKEAREMIYTVTPDHVYSPVPIAPVGYEIIAFRPPKKDETFISAIGDCILTVSEIDFSWSSPRFILRPIVPKRYVFEETGEVRSPLEGEFYVTPSRGVMKALWECKGKYPIVRLIKE